MVFVSTPVIVPRIFVIGGPRSGKSTISKKLEKELNVVRLTMSKVISQVVESKTGISHLFRTYIPELGKQLTKLLKLGLWIVDELQVAALDQILRSADCQTRGFENSPILLNCRYVLDGFPMTQQQVSLLESRGIIPNQVLYMELNRSVAIQRCKVPLNERNKESEFRSLEDVVIKREILWRFLFQ